ncbi:MAG TPA: SpoIIE family protein phosphatase [Trebonia sp.]|jgi:PAS domain S-box-containing protein|nr:SpoIIE family protein phosphatase [Trebonia sp.]
MHSISAPGGDRDRRALLRELLVNLPSAVGYVSGPDLTFEFANEEYRRMFDDRPLIGRPLREALHDLPPDRLRALERVIETGEAYVGYEAEFLVRRLDGEPEQMFLDFVYQPVRNDDGEFDGVLLYGIDVTGHVQNRHRLEQLTRDLASSEERYRTLFETLPLGVIHFDQNGTVIGANAAAAAMIGQPAAEMTTWPLPWTRTAVHEDGSPYEREELPVVRALVGGELVQDIIMGMPGEGTGDTRWLRATAVPDARDADGKPQRAYVMLRDVTAQRRAERVFRESSRMLGRLREANVLGMLVSNEDGQLLEANDAYLDLVGYARADLDAGRITRASLTPPDYEEADEDALEQLRTTGVCQPYEKEHVHKDGHRVPILVGAAVIDWHPIRWVMFVVDLSARQRAEEERTALLAREQAARAEADTAWERLTFLMRAGNLVAATRNPDDVLERVTQLVVPSLADSCLAFMPTPDGQLRVIKSTHRDAAKAQVLKRLREFPIATAGPLLSQRAYTTGITQLAREYDPTSPEWVHAAPDVMEVLSEVRSGSVVAVPLLADARPLGALLLGRGPDRPPFAENDAAVLEELARRLAAGLANVAAFAREHTVAETLQHALVPDEPPPIAGLDLAVRYLPATDGVHVGGDWYDAFPLDDHRVGLVIGDVAGHSITSASIMGQVRSLLHGYAIDNPFPPDVMRRSNAAMCQMLPDALATAWYGVLDTASGSLVYANAGHPPPLVSHGHGHAEYLEAGKGTMFGVTPATEFCASRREVRPGSRLLFYTDGLVEDRRRDIAEGLGALRVALEKVPGDSAEDACQFAQASMLGSAARADDVCILVVGLPPR